MNSPEEPFRRTFHPAISNEEIWPGPAGYPWAASGAHCLTREALLRRAPGDRLLATWTTGGFTEPWEGNFTMIRLSEDNGATWRDVGSFRHPKGGLFTSEIFSPREGEFHAFITLFRTNGIWMTQLHNYRAISRDGGETWTGPHSIPGGIQGVWPNRAIRHSSGRWVIPVNWAELIGDEWAEPSVGNPPSVAQCGQRILSQTILPHGSNGSLLYGHGNQWADRNHRYVCGVLLSDDEGATFSLRGYLRGGKHGHLIEPRVVETSDGHMVMLIRSQRDGRLWQSESRDRGETWDGPVRTDIPNPAAKVCLLRAQDGRIFLIHNPVEIGGLTYGQRNPLSLWISSDDMRTWPVRVDLVRDADPARSLNYPDGFIDETRREIVICWEDAIRVYLCRIPLDIC